MRICALSLRAHQKKLSNYSLILLKRFEKFLRVGFSSRQRVIGRTDLLTQVSRGDAALDDLDLNPILVRADIEDALKVAVICSNRGAETLDAQMVVDAKLALENGSNAARTMLRIPSARLAPGYHRTLFVDLV